MRYVYWTIATVSYLCRQRSGIGADDCHFPHFERLKDSVLVYIEVEADRLEILNEQ